MHRYAHYTPMTDTVELAACHRGAPMTEVRRPRRTRRRGHPGPRMTDHPRQPAAAGDRFVAPAGLVVVRRCSRNPDRPWVDIFVQQASGAHWAKRMPTGIPADWERLTAR
jgi:hypothetical protein